MIKEILKEFNVNLKGDIINISNRKYLVEDYMKDKMNNYTYHIGTYLGEKVPSLILLETIAKKSDKKTMVEDKPAYLFSCGRDILNAKNSKLTGKGYTIIIDKNNNVIGLAKKEKGILKNITDIGKFIRKDIGRLHQL